MVELNDSRYVYHPLMQIISVLSVAMKRYVAIASQLFIEKVKATQTKPAYAD
ncbi:hypothetical protein NIES2100_18040 [Calothrix sp. NIES-2100]|nr:hypothetical protein NIES2100_18040 [Calothrix sp. NIES-2100]